jgi:hypothetical protein
MAFMVRASRPISSPVAGDPPASVDVVARQLGDLGADGVDRSQCPPDGRPCHRRHQQHEQRCPDEQDRPHQAERLVHRLEAAGHVDRDRALRGRGSQRQQPVGAAEAGQAVDRARRELTFGPERADRRSAAQVGARRHDPSRVGDDLAGGVVLQAQPRGKRALAGQRGDVVGPDVGHVVEVPHQRPVQQGQHGDAADQQRHAEDQRRCQRGPGPHGPPPA